MSGSGLTFSEPRKASGITRHRPPHASISAANSSCWRTFSQSISQPEPSLRLDNSTAAKAWAPAGHPANDQTPPVTPLGTNRSKPVVSRGALPSARFPDVCKIRLQPITEFLTGATRLPDHPMAIQNV
ncbi:hypothetical protein EBT23_03005 [bacterium]|nr:hypothetical protein [bacterium]